MKPFYEIKHDWDIEDLAEFYKYDDYFKKMCIKHADDKMGETFRELLIINQNKIKLLKKEYKKRYGHLPTMELIRKACDYETNRNN